MRKLFVIVILLTSMISCAQNIVVKTIEFNSLTRGYTENVTINSDSVVVSKGGNRKEQQDLTARILSKKEWKSLKEYFTSIDVTNIPSLESPTNKRAYDGARHSKIIISTKDGTYEHLFDDENPHPDLIKLMEHIAAIRNKQ